MVSDWATELIQNLAAVVTERSLYVSLSSNFKWQQMRRWWLDFGVWAVSQTLSKGLSEVAESYRPTASNFKTNHRKNLKIREKKTKKLKKNYIDVYFFPALFRFTKIKDRLARETDQYSVMSIEWWYVECSKRALLFDHVIVNWFSSRYCFSCTSDVDLICILLSSGCRTSLGRQGCTKNCLLTLWKGISISRSLNAIQRHLQYCADFFKYAARWYLGGKNTVRYYCTDRFITYGNRSHHIRV